jgi:hypothetical protein
MTTIEYIAPRHLPISVSDLRHWRATQRLTSKFPTIKNNKATPRTCEAGATLAPLTSGYPINYGLRYVTQPTNAQR